MSTDIKAEAAGRCHVTMLVKSISSFERSLDGLEITICLNSGQRYAYLFGNVQDAQGFSQRLVSLMGSSNPQTIATITVQRGAHPSIESANVTEEVMFSSEGPGQVKI